MTTALTLNPEGGVALGRVMMPSEPGVLLSPIMAGICGTDLQIVNGTRPDTAHVLGHEAVAKVLTIDCPTDLQPGDRVVFSPVNSANPQEVLGHSIDGVFARRVSISHRLVREGILVKCVPQLDDSLAILAEPLSAALFGIELSRIATPIRSAIVLGAGPMGLLVSLALELTAGASVVLVNRSRTRADWAAKQLILRTGPAVSLADGLDHLLPAEGVDAVFVCTQRLESSVAGDLAARWVRDGGCIDFVAGGSDRHGSFIAMDIDDVRRTNACGRIGHDGIRTLRLPCGKLFRVTGHRGAGRRNVLAAMELLHANRARFLPLITHTVDFIDAAAVINRLAFGGDPRLVRGRTCIKAVIDFGEGRGRR